MKIESVDDYLAKMEDIESYTYVRDSDGDIYQQSDCDRLFWQMGDAELIDIKHMYFPLETLDD